MSHNLLDLDALAPETKKVKLGGKVLDVHPPRVKNLIEIQKLFTSFEGMKPKEQVDAMGRIVEVLKPIVPDIESVDFTIQQLMALLEFANAQAAPEELEKAKSVKTVKKGADSPKQ